MRRKWGRFVLNKIDRRFPPSAQRRLTAALAGLLTCLVLILLLEKNRGAALRIFFLSPLQLPQGLGGLISAATPVVLVALAFSTVFQCRRYSFAPVGSFLLSASLVTIFLLRGGDRPSWYLVPVALLLSILIGALVSLLPGALLVRRKINLTLSSLLLDYLILQIVAFLLATVMRDGSGMDTLASFAIPERMWLAPLIPSMNIRMGTLLAALATVLMYLLLNRSRIGYGIRAVGASESLAGYVGLNAAKISLAAQMIGGALAGLAAAIEMMGIQPRYIWEAKFPPAVFLGLLAAVFYDYNPAWVSLGALFFTYLWEGSSALESATLFSSELGLAAGAVTILVLFALRDIAVFDRLAVLLGRAPAKAAPLPAQESPAAAQPDLPEDTEAEQQELLDDDDGESEEEADQ